jgi:hypothetical protein
MAIVEVRSPRDNRKPGGSLPRLSNPGAPIARADQLGRHVTRHIGKSTLPVGSPIGPPGDGNRPIEPTVR